MNVVLYGATGRAGSRIMTELLARGHHVVAIARDATKLSPTPGVVVQEDDCSDVNRTAGIIKGADAVISAFAPPPDNTDELIHFTNRLARAVETSGVSRLLVVGGAGGLEVAPGVTLLASGHLPPEWTPIATAHSKTFDALRASAINWTYVAPPAYFDPGERTGKYRLGKDQLLMDEQGQSRISMEDYAIAMVDELESAKNIRRKMTVGY